MLVIGLGFLYGWSRRWYSKKENRAVLSFTDKMQSNKWQTKILEYHFNSSDWLALSFFLLTLALCTPAGEIFLIFPGFSKYRTVGQWYQNWEWNCRNSIMKKMKNLKTNCNALIQMKQMWEKSRSSIQLIMFRLSGMMQRKDIERHHNLYVPL